MSNIQASSEKASDCCINDAFTEILNNAKKNGKQVSAPSIDAKTFIQRNIRATTIAAQKELIVAYIGSYNVREPHGVQLDNAVRTARNALRPVPAQPELVPVKASKMSQAGVVGDLLRRGQDLKARIQNAKDFEYSDTVVDGMKAELESVVGAIEAVTH